MDCHSHRRSRGRASLGLAALAASLLALGCAASGGPGGSGEPERVSRYDDVRGGAHRAAPRTDAATRDPERASLHYRMGAKNLREGRVAMAIRELRQAAEYDPKDEWVQLALAEAYIQRGHLEDAESHLTRAIELEPGFQEAMLHLSALYIHMERYADAVPLARQLADDPTHPQPSRALTNLGFAELQLGRLSDARGHLELATQYDPRQWQAWLNLGILEEKEGRKLEALQHFEKVLERRPGPMAEAEVHHRMALLYISLGNHERALEHLSVSAARHPNGPWAKRSEEYLKRLR